MNEIINRILARLRMREVAPELAKVGKEEEINKMASRILERILTQRTYEKLPKGMADEDAMVMIVDLVGSGGKIIQYYQETVKAEEGE